LSGSTCDFINLIQHKSPNDFNRWTEENNVRVVAAELFDQELCIFTGHETSGVPVDVTQIADCVEIDMPGPGFCLNTAQAANIVLYEASKQFLER
jgi:tRNA G18 (ribose-2'-O)-methylase SpoU